MEAHNQRRNGAAMNHALAFALGTAVGIAAQALVRQPPPVLTIAKSDMLPPPVVLDANPYNDAPDHLPRRAPGAGREFPPLLSGPF